MSTMQEFADFSITFNTDIIRIRRKISEYIPENYKGFIEYGNKLIEERLVLVTSLASLNKYLDKSSLEYLPEKTKSSTELERKVSLDASTCPIRYLRDVCEGVLKTLDFKLSFINNQYDMSK
uniref:Uncharacterized protein n=1 Tax=viral metagenome TaxID=1070528 RepID=A0A6M3KGA2_9ZZZZ